MHDDMPSEAVSLREYFERIIELQQAANERAIALYQTEIERRLQGLNELRKEVTEDRSELVKREVFDLSVKEVRSQLEMAKKEDAGYRERVSTRFTGIETRLTKSETRSLTWTAALGVFIVIVQIVISYLSK